MLYLPKKLNVWFSSKAQERGLDVGEIMYFAMREFATNRGFECNHPPDQHVLHKKGNPLYRCNLCGFLFYRKLNQKLVNNELVKSYDIIPRIEAI